jgi:hypothetical protein
LFDGEAIVMDFNEEQVDYIGVSFLYKMNVRKNKRNKRALVFKSLGENSKRATVI